MENSGVVVLAADGTLMHKFQVARTDAISQMFDRDGRCGTIHSTTMFFAELDKAVESLLTASRAEGRLEGVKAGIEAAIGWIEDEFATVGYSEKGSLGERIRRSLPADKIAHDSMCRNESSVIAEDLSKTKEAI